MPIKLGLSQDADFDDRVHNSAPAGEMLEVITKRNATSGGLPAVVLAFDSEVNGEVVRVQQAVTLRELVTAVKTVAAHHEEFDPAWQRGDVPRF
jgi:hypothetical protein